MIDFLEGRLAVVREKIAALREAETHLADKLARYRDGGLDSSYPDSGRPAPDGTSR